MSDPATLAADETTNRLVAFHVMNWYGAAVDFAWWRPSERIDHAWDVMKRMRDLGWTLWIGPSADNGPGWDVQIKRRTNAHLRVTAETAPLAICRAAMFAAAGLVPDKETMA